MIDVCQKKKRQRTKGMDIAVLFFHQADNVVIDKKRFGL